MKRIFLTSGLVLCMACPAFAAGSWSGATGGTQSTGCTEGNLGTDSGPATLTAIWNDNRSTITLVTNSTDNGWDGTSTLSETTLYGVPQDTTHVYTMNGSNNLVEYTTYAVGTTGAYTPLGKTATMTFNYNLPSIAVPTGQAAATPYAANAQTLGNGYAANSTTANRQFDGFYSDATGGTRYIDDSGSVLSAGTQAAGGLENGGSDTWYAQYKCADATLPTVSLTGYTFNGWKVSTANDAAAASACIKDDTTVYASWTPHTGTISYNCNTAPGSNTVADLTGSAPDGGTLTYDAVYTIAGNTGSCAYPGYTFAGWSCTDLSGATSGDVNYAAGAQGTYKVAAQGATITCTARWTEKTIEPITWTAPNANAGWSSTGASTSCTYDSTITLPTAPERTGYTFGGWQVVSQ